MLRGDNRCADCARPGKYGGRILQPNPDKPCARRLRRIGRADLAYHRVPRCGNEGRLVYVITRDPQGRANDLMFDPNTALD